MEIVKVKALDSFSHGRLRMEREQTANINSLDAEDLVKVGLVEIVGAPDEPEAVDDLVGGKMEPVTQNKMDQAPSNKRRDR